MEGTRPWETKCNLDSFFLMSHNKIGIIMCIRDANGGYVLAKKTWFALLCLVDVGEALGLFEALQ